MLLLNPYRFTSAPIIGCAYPLDDDGTIATAFGYGYAGPAVGDGQQMQYTTTGSGNMVLVAAGSLTSARFPRGASPIGIEYQVSSYGGSGNNANGAILITNSGGALVNAGTVPAIADGDNIQFEITSDGTVTAKKNGVSASISWLNPSWQKTVGATDYFCPYLAVNDSIPGQLVDIQLVTNAANMVGTYSANAVDICGNTIP